MQFKSCEKIRGQLGKNVFLQLLDMKSHGLAAKVINVVVDHFGGKAMPYSAMASCFDLMQRELVVIFRQNGLPTFIFYLTMLSLDGSNVFERLVRLELDVNETLFNIQFKKGALARGLYAPLRALRCFSCHWFVKKVVFKSGKQIRCLGPHTAGVLQNKVERTLMRLKVAYYERQKGAGIGWTAHPTRLEFGGMDLGRKVTELVVEHFAGMEMTPQVVGENIILLQRAVYKLFSDNEKDGGLQVFEVISGYFTDLFDVEIGMKAAL